MDRNKSSVELEIERHVLPQTKKLSDGSYEKIFTRNRRNESGIFTYNCKLCSVANLPGERAVQTHIAGKKHQQRLQSDYVPNALIFRGPIAVKQKAIPSFYQNPPPVPGSEDQNDTMSYLENISKLQNKSLIGLEYVVELLDVTAKEPFYICTLCDKRCDPRNIMPQITSHRHRMKYLDFHFPNVMSHLNRDKKFNMDMNYREHVLSKVSSMIEKQNGRLKPTICDHSNFEKNKEIIEGEIKRKKHFTETEEFVKELLEELKPMREMVGLDNVSSEEDNNDHNDLRPESDNARSKTVLSSRLAHLKQEHSVTRQKILTPRELQEQSNNKLQETYIIEKYKAQVELAVKELEKNFKLFEARPESHPDYSKEWKQFWSRRFKQLVAEGKNANDHDYKPEWISFWTKRMKELHNIDIEKKKEMFRKKLGLSIDSVSKISYSPSTSNRRRSRSRSRSPRSQRKHRKSRSPKGVVEISDDSDDNFSRKLSEPRMKRYRTDYSEERSHSRFSDDSRGSDYHSKDAYDNYTSRNRDYDRNSKKSKSPEIVDDGPVNLISVCRLLSALESELGLMAKTVIDLLAKAVAAEKKSPNSADELLFNTENSNILETVKEKLKGVLTANLISTNKIVAVKRAVQNIATLLHENSLRKPTKSEKEKAKQEFINAKDEASNNEDPIALAKLQIATAITESLMKEGRSNVSAEELEALVQSFLSAANDEEDEMELDEKDKETPVKSNEKLDKKEEPKKQETSSGLENLTDEDLQTLLRNFADLNSDEQSHLISYLSKIEQTNPSRVEKLRKYVNIGDADDADFDESKDDLDMDLATGVSTEEKTTSFEKQTILNDDDDEDFNDEQMAKHLSSQTETISHFSSVPGQSSIQDSSGLAESLMSSLMQSSMPMQVQNVWPAQNDSGMNMSNFYPPQNYSSYQDTLYDQNQHMAMGMQMMSQPSTSSWPQSAASSFFQEIQQNEHQKFNREKTAFRKKHPQNSNNLQLTGKKRK